MSYLSGYTQAVKCSGSVSATLTPCARVWTFIRNTSDVHTVSDMNVLMKYADNTDLLVPDYSEFELAKEFDNIDYSATLLRLW